MLWFCFKSCFKYCSSSAAVLSIVLHSSFVDLSNRRSFCRKRFHEGTAIICSTCLYAVLVRRAALTFCTLRDSRCYIFFALALISLRMAVWAVDFVVLNVAMLPEIIHRTRWQIGNARLAPRLLRVVVI